MIRLPMIEVTAVAKFFPTGFALKNVDLTVTSGEVCGLIGPNGAGKTTLLRILATVLKSSSGCVRVAGFELPRDAAEVRRRIGYMPDGFSTYDELRVDSFLEFFAHIYELPRAGIDRTIADILRLVDLDRVRNASISGLSLGVRQRLSLARVLLHDPQVLLLDEPVSGLDPRARVEMRELLRELGTMGKAVLISSHVLNDLADLCDRLVVLEQGEVIFSGTLDELTRRAAPERTIEVGVDGERESAAAEFLEAQEWCGDTQRLGPGVLLVSVKSPEPSPADISAALFGAGFRVTRFLERKIDLEEAFLRLTDGAVS